MENTNALIVCSLALPVPRQYSQANTGVATANNAIMMIPRLMPSALFSAKMSLRTKPG